MPISHTKRGADDRSLRGCPELTLVLRRDAHSSGIAVWMKTPSGGDWPHAKLLLSERWNDPLPGEEGCLRIAVQALKQILGGICVEESGQDR